MFSHALEFIPLDSYNILIYKSYLNFMLKEIKFLNLESMSYPR